MIQEMGVIIIYNSLLQSRSLDTIFYTVPVFFCSTNTIIGKFIEHCRGFTTSNLLIPSFILTFVGGWSTAGCSLRGIVNDTIICECNHMTNFAALVVSNF